MITVYSWAEAPEELKALSDHGGDEEHVIVATGHGYINEVMSMRDDFDAVVQVLDRWDLGRGTEHVIEIGDEDSALVYITAHA